MSGKNRGSSGEAKVCKSTLPRRCATTTLVSRSIPLARSAMRLHFARFGYGFLERSAVSVIQGAMSLTQYRGALTASGCTKSLHIAGYLHLLPQRKALNVAHDGLDDCHDQTLNMAAEKAKCRKKLWVGSSVWIQSMKSIASTC